WTLTDQFAPSKTEISPSSSRMFPFTVFTLQDTLYLVPSVLPAAAVRLQGQDPHGGLDLLGTVDHRRRRVNGDERHDLGDHGDDDGQRFSAGLLPSTGLCIKGVAQGPALKTLTRPVTEYP